MDFTNPLVYGAPAFIGFILLELTYSKHDKKDVKKKDLYKWKDLAASVSMGLGSAIIAPLTKTVSSRVQSCDRLLGTDLST